MLQALLKNKLKDSYIDPTFKPSEDSLTSSVLGLLQFLPDGEFWNLLRKSCGRNSILTQDIGKIEKFLFWAQLDAEGTSNSLYVEPDVLIVSNKYAVIIEAKKTDEWGQHEDQWENEIRSVLNTYPESNRKIMLIALGGNDSMKDRVCTVNKKKINVYTASWFNLLNAIIDAREKILSSYGENDDLSKLRILTSAIDAMAKHNYLKLRWLASLNVVDIDIESKKVLKDGFEFDNTPLMNKLFPSIKEINKYNFDAIWMLRK